MLREFDDKASCEVYIPIKTYNDEKFLVELLELCECYLEPLKYGVSKEEIIELYEYEKKGESLIDFLLLKRYIAREDCFLNLAKKYIVDSECLKLYFNDVKYCDIEFYFERYSISEIRNINVDAQIKHIGIIDKNDRFVG